MKTIRLMLLVAIPVLAPIGLVVGPSAQPASACSGAVAHPLAYGGCMAGETEDAAWQQEGFVLDEANSVLSKVPAPSSWGERHVCAGAEQIDHFWCFYFPFPT